MLVEFLEIETSTCISRHSHTTFPSGGFTIYSDACKTCLGCILIQNRQGVAYAYYCGFFFEIQRHYLYEKACKAFANHKSLKYIFNQKELNVR